MTPAEGEEPEAFAERVHDWMQATATRLTEGRVPVLGWQRAGGDGSDTG
jgi:hypothetical protein